MATAAHIGSVGVIGLGAMGYQMARHLKTKGFQVSGFDVSSEANGRAGDVGIEVRASAAAVGEGSDVVIVMVATDEQVVDVIAGDNGLIEVLKPGSVICVASSVAPDTCRALEAKAAARDVGVLDTPVVRGQEAADNGTLLILVGGEARWFERARPALDTFGSDIVHVGPSGAGQIAKTTNNLLLWACMCANYEALSLAKRLGADVPALIKALGASSGANWSLSQWGRSTPKWVEKDMDVALELAQDAKLAMPLSALVAQLMKGMDRDRMRALLD